MEIRKIRIKAQGSPRNAPVFPVYFSLKIPGSDPDKPDILFTPMTGSLGQMKLGMGASVDKNKTE